MREKINAELVVKFKGMLRQPEEVFSLFVKAYPAVNKDGEFWRIALREAENSSRINEKNLIFLQEAKEKHECSNKRIFSTSRIGIIGCTYYGHK